MPTTTPVFLVVRWALIELVLRYRLLGSLKRGAASAAAGGSPLVEHWVGLVSPVHAGSLPVDHGADSYGQSDSAMVPKSTTASRLDGPLEPSVKAKSPTSRLTDHCRNCSEKSGSAMPARMYRFSTCAVVAKMLHTPRLPWLLTGL